MTLLDLRPDTLAKFVIINAKIFYHKDNHYLVRVAKYFLSLNFAQHATERNASQSPNTVYEPLNRPYSTIKGKEFHSIF